MVEAVLKVTQAGPHVSYQDRGRVGYLRFGVPASGPMDRFAHDAALAALGLSADATAIEVSMGGLLLTCQRGEVAFAVCGGGFTVEVDGQRAGSWTVGRLTEGGRLTIRPGGFGNWCTLAFAGSLRTERWLGHGATHAASGLGGGVVTSGSVITIDDARTVPEREGVIATELSDGLGRDPVEVPVVMGPQEAAFAPDALEAFVTGPFGVTPVFDRMGMRLDGPALDLADALSIPSEPALRGAVQVAGDGVASVLLADHQTTGGYPKIATIPMHHTDRLAQARPGQKLRFKPVTPQEAIAESRRVALRRKDAMDRIATPRGSLSERLMRENLISGIVGEET
ncbi:biotin-dependent carboxyltransferase family protein [Maritimibacter sp. DP1N21-5]|uniref:5-oxoprolinase subunit C family protein n=1 Tax=Maritimibacter sp. DP1N21-5 TaxID=2836867 RepID=UPI001C492FBF|nr:biotin-dependent carboxyltransferase family protein [Maritimibacter sp. DP1N21-5]MBV7407426.1 biotin-dependent carboxyltransferase family protein [Maritimibacter sp. DP1N21-5]